MLWILSNPVVQQYRWHKTWNFKTLTTNLLCVYHRKSFFYIRYNKTAFPDCTIKKKIIKICLLDLIICLCKHYSSEPHLLCNKLAWKNIFIVVVSNNESQKFHCNTHEYLQVIFSLPKLKIIKFRKLIHFVNLFSPVRACAYEYPHNQATN